MALFKNKGDASRSEVFSFIFKGYNKYANKTGITVYLMLGILMIYALRRSGVYGYRAVVIA